MRLATGIGALMAMMALLGGLPATLHAQNGGWATPKGEQDFLQNRYPELKGLTNSADDQKKALDLCSKYGGSNQAISLPVVRCNAAAHVYMSEGQKAVDAEEQRQANLQQQQAADRQHQQAVADEQQQAATLQQLQAEGLQRQQDLDRQHQQAVALQQQQAATLQQQKINAKASLEQCRATAAYKRHADAQLINSDVPFANAQKNAEIQRLQQVRPTTAGDSDEINRRISTDRAQIDMMSDLLKKAITEYQSFGGDPGSQGQVSKDANENPCAQLGDDN